MNSRATPLPPSPSPRPSPAPCPSAHAGVPISIRAASSRRPAAGPSRPLAWWVDHFRNNRLRDWDIPWHASSVPPPPSEFARIATSIAAFQRGESSEARGYLKKSAAFAFHTGDAAFHEASVLFVREENEHAALLLRFMNGAGIPARRSVLSDGIFRRVRSLGDLGWSSRVLLVAELVAQEYYPCLRAATSHPVLRRVCDKLIHDEFAHIRFQVERIARLEAALPPASRRLRDWMQGVLLVGAAFEVYRAHRAVLAHIGLLGFLRGLFRRFRRATKAVRALSAAHPGAA